MIPTSRRNNTQFSYPDRKTWFQQRALLSAALSWAHVFVLHNKPQSRHFWKDQVWSICWSQFRLKINGLRHRKIIAMLHRRTLEPLILHIERNITSTLHDKSIDLVGSFNYRKELNYATICITYKNTLRQWRIPVIAMVSRWSISHHLLKCECSRASDLIPPH